MGDRRNAYRFWWGNLREEDHLEDPGIDERIILKHRSLKSGMAGMDWIDPPQDRDK
jgi:hypothetical protein